MSNLIRAVKSSWLPMPTANSNDADIEIPRDTYRLAQMAIAAAERANQSQINRMIRAGRQNTLPSITAPMRPFPTVVSVVTLPMSR